MSAERLPIAAIAGLGLTQNIGYGILAPSMARDFSVSNEWIFGALSVALLAGGFLAPWLGKWIDRYGAGRMMTIGSILAAVSLILCSLSPNALMFAGALTIIEIAANLVQYGAAFALLVQLAPNVAQRSITYLTLIAGFASTIFWPITTTLQHWLTWQQTYLLFACLHLFLCVPVHLLLVRSIAKSGRKRSTNGTVTTAFSGDLPAHQRRKGFVLVLVAFSLQALVAAATLVHMVPMLGALGLAGSAAFIGAIFGPSQVASRLINMLGGKNLTPIRLAVISASLMGLALIVLLFGAPSIIATIMFACLFGFGNGLFSIVSGTLPLSLFGSDGYGAMQGKIMSARLIISATAPFAMALGLETFGVKTNLAVMIGTSLLSVIILFCITRLRENSIRRA